jgi:hypothetical protein
MASPGSHRRVKPCPVCGGQCSRFPDLATDATNPFLGARAKDMEARPIRPKPRPKGKRRPAEDRARHLEEDR